MTITDAGGADETFRLTDTTGGCTGRGAGSRAPHDVLSINRRLEAANSNFAMAWRKLGAALGNAGRPFAEAHHHILRYQCLSAHLTT